MPGLAEEYVDGEGEIRRLATHSAASGPNPPADTTGSHAPPPSTPCMSGSPLASPSCFCDPPDAAINFSTASTIGDDGGECHDVRMRGPTLLNSWKTCARVRSRTGASDQRTARGSLEKVREAS